MVGTALVAGGASALNQFWERDTDRLMRRTRLRPLPDARLHPQDALWFGMLLSARRHRASCRSPSTRSPPASRPLTLVSYVLALHAAQAADVAVDDRRRHSRRVAGGDRLDGGDQLAVDRGLGAVRHRVHVADAALPGHRVDVPRRLRARGHSAAAGDPTRWPQHGRTSGALRGRTDSGQLAAHGRRPRERVLSWSARSRWARS